LRRVVVHFSQRERPFSARTSVLQPVASARSSLVTTIDRSLPFPSEIQVFIANRTRDRSFRHSSWQSEVIAVLDRESCRYLSKQIAREMRVSSARVRRSASQVTSLPPRHTSACLCNVGVPLSDCESSHVSSARASALAEANRPILRGAQRARVSSPSPTCTLRASGRGPHGKYKRASFVFTDTDERTLINFNEPEPRGRLGGSIRNSVVTCADVARRIHRFPRISPTKLGGA